MDDLFGKTTVSKDEEKQFINECDAKLPKAAICKKIEEELTAIVEHYSFGIGTARKILKIHNKKYKTEPKLKDKKGTARLTEDNKKLIISLYEQGTKPSAIASSMHISKATVCNTLKRNSELYRKNNPIKKDEELYSLILDKYNQKKDIKTILEELKAEGKKKSRGFVENVIAMQGIDISQGKSDKEKQLIVDSYIRLGTEKAIKELRTKGIETSPTNLRRIVKELGEKRDNSDSYRAYTLDKDYFETIDTEEKAYWLGFIAADGSVQDNKLEIELKDTDKNHLEKINKALSSNKPVEETSHYLEKYGNKKSVKVTFNSRKLVEDLNKYGIVKNKSLTMDINLSKIPENLHKHFWRGTIDGDGSLFENSTGNIVIELSGSYKMCEKLSQHINKMFLIDKNITPHYSIYAIRYTNKDIVIQLSKYFYSGSTISLDRKKEKAESWYK